MATNLPAPPRRPVQCSAHHLGADEVSAVAILDGPQRQGDGQGSCPRRAVPAAGRGSTTPTHAGTWPGPSGRCCAAGNRSIPPTSEPRTRTSRWFRADEALFGHSSEVHRAIVLWDKVGGGLGLSKAIADNLGQYTQALWPGNPDPLVPDRSLLFVSRDHLDVGTGGTPPRYSKALTWHWMKAALRTSSTSRTPRRGAASRLPQCRTNCPSRACSPGSVSNRVASGCDAGGNRQLPQQHHAVPADRSMCTSGIHPEEVTSDTATPYSVLPQLPAIARVE